MDLNAIKSMNLIGVAPYFFVRDVQKSGEFYRDVLGFNFDRVWGEPPCFTIVDRDGLHLMLSQSPENVRPHRVIECGKEETAWQAYFWVRDVEALRLEFIAKGAKIIRGPEDTFYKNREIELMDIDGHVLCFGQDISKRS